MVRKSRLLAVMMAAVMLVAVGAPGVFAAVGTADVTVQEIVVADMYESDDTSATARVLPEVSWHSFDTYDDVDTFKISADETGTPFCIEAQMWSGHSELDTEVYVYGPDWDGIDFTAYLDMNDDHSDDYYFATYSSGMFFTAPAPGTYYVVVRQNDNGEIGNYKLTWTKGIGTRVAGANRMETAVEISRMMFSDASFPAYENGMSAVVLASAYSFPDALAGGVLASVLDGGLLLTPSDMLAAQTKAEISRVLSESYWSDITTTTVYVLGETNAISAAVMAEVGQIREVEEVVRVGGDTRFDTAAMIAQTVDDEYGADTTAFIVNSDAWPDALAAGPVASWFGSPILLTRADSTPVATNDIIDDLGITDLVVVGGTRVISDSTYTGLAAMVSGETTRVAGGTRYETARLIAQYGIDERGMSGDRMTLASGENFPDGLAATPLSWWTSGPLLLTPKMSLSASVKTFMDDNGPMSPMSYLVGGPAAVADAVYNEWKMYYDAEDYIP